MSNCVRASAASCQCLRNTEEKWLYLLAGYFWILRSINKMNSRSFLASILALPALTAAVVLTPSEVSARVTLEGCIKWFHPEYPVRNRWPLKFSEVEVEWDGIGDDPEVMTNANGCYKASVRNAAIGFNGHDMNAQVYAKRAFKGRNGRRNLYVRVYENQVDIYPTYVETIQKHINDNKKGTINLWLGNNKEFGGTRRNFKKGNLQLLFEIKE